MPQKVIGQNLQSFAVKKVLHYMYEDPGKSLPKLLDWADKFDKDNMFASQRKVFHNIIENPDNNWYRLIKSLWTDIDPEVRKTFFENFMVNTSAHSTDMQSLEDVENLYGKRKPYTENGWKLPTSCGTAHIAEQVAWTAGDRINKRVNFSA